MLEIKLQAWVKPFKRMVQIKGFTSYHEGNITIFDNVGSYTYMSADVVLRQYTGLKDKNGKEIYEGDILQYDSPSPKYQYKHQVIFDDGRYRFSGMDSFVFNKMNLNYKRGYKVIGNIYENPELLEEGK